MGGWALEVGKMVMYMSFPVALFHYFNQPEYFEKWVITKKRELYPPENLMDLEQLEEAKLAHRRKLDEKFQSALDEIDRREKQAM